MGLELRQPAQCAHPPWLEAPRKAGPPPMPPFFSVPDVAYVTLRWAFRHLLQQRIRNKGAGGAWQNARGGGGEHGNPSRQNPYPLSPNPFVPGA